MKRWKQHGLIGLALFLPGLGLLALTSDAAVKPKPEFKKYTETIPGSKVVFEMVPIPAGKYMMGSPDSEKGREVDEGPQHQVEVKEFWMGSREVTWDEFDLFWKDRPGSKEDREPEMPKDADAVTRPTPPYSDETFEHGREGHPVLCISWHSAMQYCRWLSIKTGKVYRLPTEAEWEWAARAGTRTAYFFGDDPKNLSDYAWFAGNSENHTHQVGTRKPNPYGLYDIYGNVMEWCADQYDKKFYDTFPVGKIAIQPVNLPSEKRFSHVARGGAWSEEADQCRSASRRGSDKTWIKLDPQRPQSIWWLTSADWVGFRIVRALEEQENLKGFRSKITRESK
jgi:formylglycine-generating enzyme required for sulfatase activity